MYSRSIHVICSACAFAWDTAGPTSVCVQTDPGAVPALLNGSFARTACPQCGTVHTVHAPLLLWTDLDAERYVVVVDASRRAEVRSLERTLEADFQSTYVRRKNPVWSAPERVQKRLVFGVDALREKTVAWSAGLDDRWLELLKFSLRQSDTGRNLGLRIDALDRATPTHLWFASSVGPLDIERETYDALLRLGDPAVSRFSALFQGWWVDADRLSDLPT